MKNSLAIAYAVKRRAGKNKMADGGDVSQDQSKSIGKRIGYPGMADGGEVKNEKLKPEHEDLSAEERSHLLEDLEREESTYGKAEMEAKLKRARAEENGEDPELLVGSSEEEPEYAHGGMMKSPTAMAKHIMMKRRMAEGGSVPEPDAKKAKEMQDSAMESGWQPKRWAANLKEGLGLSASNDEDKQHYALGGEVEDEHDMLTRGNMEDENPHKDDDFLSDEEQTELPGMAEGGDVEKKRKRKTVIAGIMRNMHSKHFGS